MKKIKKKKSNEISKKKLKNKGIQKKINFLWETRALKYIPRASLTFLNGPIKENVAEHSFCATIIGWVLSKMEKADENKVIKMLLLHDLPEVRGGERNLINKFYTQPLNEKAILKEISKDYQLEDFSLVSLIEEFNSQRTIEARVAKDADTLSQMLLEKECLGLGNIRAKRWLDTSFMRLETPSGKKLGETLVEIDPDKWWLDIVKKYILKIKFLSPDDPFFYEA
jgi:putative hydrolase of HD superfamily